MAAGEAVRASAPLPCSLLLGLAAVPAFSATAQSPPPSQPPCKPCAAWNQSQPPFRIFGNTYYVGVRGLASILLTSPRGDVLIDGDLPQSAPQIVAHIRALGFRIVDVKLILNSHDHYDHAGGLAALQRLSGAPVAASAPSARVLRAGRSGTDDPQYGVAPSFPRVVRVRVIRDGETVRVGDLALTAYFTPGHTPGGTTWTWRSCEKSRCLQMVYADSLTPVSAAGFQFTRSAAYPHAVADFERSLARLERLRCDILLTPHPEASDLWGRLERRARGDADALIDPEACKTYAARAREALKRRLARERGI